MKLDLCLYVENQLDAEFRNIDYKNLYKRNHIQWGAILTDFFNNNIGLAEACRLIQEDMQAEFNFHRREGHLYEYLTS